MMKKLLAIAASALMLLSFTETTSAQGRRHEDGWWDKVKAEKVAFLTDYIGLTSAEAEKFWPIYNEAEKEKCESFDKTMEAFKALEEAAKSGKGASEALDKYLEAQRKGIDIDAKYAKSYKKILSDGKIAKVFLGEEMFRRNQIHRLHKGPKSPDKK